MSPTSLNRRRAFSLMEMLAVVLILSVLASVAIALYGSTRKGATARTCAANLAAIQSAEDSYALRNRCYATLADLVGGPEGLHQAPTCSLDGSAIQILEFNTTTPITTGRTGKIDIKCPNAATHATDLGIAASKWTLTMGDVGEVPLP